MQNFIHLRLHSEFSIVDSVIRICDVIDFAHNDGMFALALTDLSNMFGFIKFYQNCFNKGIKPILGVELNVLTTDNFKYKIIVLAKNNLGLKEINNLISKSYIEKKSHSEVIVLEDWIFCGTLKNVIILSGGIFGDIAYLIDNNKLEDARCQLLKWQKFFKDDYYLEVQRVSRNNINNINFQIVNFADSLNIKLVATHPIQFLHKSDFEAHEVRVCIADGDTLDDEKRVKKFTLDQHMLSQKEMCELFSDLPDAIANTLEVAKKCNVEIELGKYFLPNFITPNNLDIKIYLANLSFSGLEDRISEIIKFTNDSIDRNLYQKRLEYEIQTINDMGFAGYFLIVADFINWAKTHNVPVGAGRGSGAGSLVAFALKITDIDPIKYGLLFERFLNAERVSMPDFDIDFCQDKRELVIDYVKQKYSADSVSQIATFGTMSSKAVIKDVGRALGLPYGLCDSISKLIINTPAKSYSLLEAYNTFNELKIRIDNADDDVRRLWELSLSLEDLTRSVGKHAAGVLIAPSKLTDFCPLYLADGMQTSQLDKDDVELVGLVKFDFLGLRNLTIIQETIENVAKLYNKTIKLSTYDFSDSNVYKLLQAGNTIAIFQLESQGMKRVLVKLEPDRFEDIIALLALYRPGPLGSGMVDDFIKRKKGIEVPNYFHPDLENCLQSTYGVIVYQEQVMQISQIIGGYTLGGADLLRRAMGKKKPEEMAMHKNLFVNGAIKKGYSADLATELFELMAKFAEYGFNKSHSAAYAVISYHTAYLKTYYLSVFMSATLSSEMDKTDKLYEIYQDCIDNKLVILAPDINYSEYRFKAVDEKHIRYGLGAIKGIGHFVVEIIVEVRQTSGLFTSFLDFCERVGKKVLNKKTLDSLIKAGCFDVLHQNRAELLSSVEEILFIISKQNDLQNQGSLFAESEGNVLSFLQDVFKYPTVAMWDTKELLQMEKQALGFYFSANLFDNYKEIINKLDLKPLTYYHIENQELFINLQNNIKEHPFELLCGIVTKINFRPLKKGGKMYFINIEDSTGNFECIIYDSDYEKYKDLLKVDEFVGIYGELLYDGYREQIKLTAKKILHIDHILIDRINRLTLYLKDSHEIDTLKESFSSDGHVKVVANYKNSKAQCKLEFGDTHKFKLNYSNIIKLNQLIGANSWEIN